MFQIKTTNGENMTQCKKVTETSTNEKEYEDFLQQLEAKNILMTINGVGPKVAECVLLYGFHRLEAFPMDVWMKKISNKFFSIFIFSFLCLYS